jgi:hypothetical protein
MHTWTSRNKKSLKERSNQPSDIIPLTIKAQHRVVRLMVVAAVYRHHCRWLAALPL